LKMPAFEWVHVQLHQQKGMISLSPPTICNSALCRMHGCGEYSISDLAELFSVSRPTVYRTLARGQK
ncbi:helix-turn-helix domain-containing protein, partial [Klebsiella pneumoniae]|uniref:helix-turn-helix domain-containing protein n=1 Tax=Klebsiella pneumoniae TaxID=573 RepID=UPI0021648072